MNTPKNQNINNSQPMPPYGNQIYNYQPQNNQNINCMNQNPEYNPMNTPRNPNINNSQSKEKSKNYLSVFSNQESSKNRYLSEVHYRKNKKLKIIV